jgi:hypothetical protein
MRSTLDGIGLGGLKGWIISCIFEGYHNAAEGTAYVSIGAENSREAMSLFATLIGEIYSIDDEILKEALGKTETDNFTFLGRNIFSLDSGGDDDSLFIFNVWEGLIPISKKSFIQERNKYMFTCVTVFYYNQKYMFTSPEMLLEGSTRYPLEEFMRQ